jgi:chromosome segregation ATPase
MNLWPFISVLASLVLILLFRRLDRRTINFNKFRRYADKLMSDFDKYLQHKKQDLSESTRDLDGVLKKAAQFLARIETEEGNLRTGVANLGEEKRELLAIKDDLDRFKEMKEEIGSEVSTIEKHLPPLKKLAKRVQSIGIRIAENEKALRSAREALPDIGREVQERTESALEEARRALIEETKTTLIPVVDEYRQNLDLIRSAQAEEMEKVKRTTAGLTDVVEKKVGELSASITACAQRISNMESKDLALIGEKIAELDSVLGETRGSFEQAQEVSLREFQRRVEEGLKAYTHALEKSKETYQQEMFVKIEGKAKDLSSYVADLEGRVESLVADFNKESENLTELLSLKAKAHQSEAEGLKGRILSEITEETERCLILLKPIVTEVNEKLQLVKKEFSSLTETMREQLESGVKSVNDDIQAFRLDVEGQKNAIFRDIEERLKATNAKLTDMDQRVEERIKQATASVSKDFIDKLREYGEGIALLEGRIGDLKIIAKTGQKMIEERIESVFREFQPDIEEKIQNIKRTTEDSFAKEREKILQKMNSIIGSVEAELKKREGTLQSFLGDVSRRIKESEEAISREQESVLKEVNDVRVEARGELVRELESLKDMFRDEKERVLGKYNKEVSAVGERIEALSSRSETVRSAIEERAGALNKKIDGFRSALEERIAELGKTVDNIRAVVGERVETAIREVEGNVRAAETSYLKTGDELTGRVRNELERVEEEVERIRETVDALKGDLVQETKNALVQFRQGVDGTFAEHRSAFSEKEREIREIVDSTVTGLRSEISRSERDAGETLKGFEDKVVMVQKKIEKRVSDIERRIADFEKESQIIKRAVEFKDEVKEEIDKLSDYIVQIKEDKKDIFELGRAIDALKKDEGDIAAKVRNLKGEKKLVFDIAKNAEAAVALVSVVEEKIKLVQSEKERLDKIQDDLKAVGQKFESLESKAARLESKEEDIEVSVETITKTKEFVANLEKRTEILRDSVGEIKGIEEDIKKRIALIEQKTAGLKENEKLADEVLTRFKSMDALVLDIETRTKQLQNAREWLAGTESRLTSISDNAERLVAELKALLEKEQALGIASSIAGAAVSGASVGDQFSKGRGAPLSRESETKVKTVLTLFDQKWTIPEICKVTKMSRGEVELILELNNR